MTERSNRRAWAGWRVRENDIDCMQGQLAHERFGRAALATDDAHLLIEAEGRLQDPVHDRLGERVCDPDHQAYRSSARPPLCGFQELASQGEDLVGIAKGDTTEVREHQLPALPREQLLAESIFEPVDLGADGRMREAKLLARTGDAPLFRNDPEIKKVMVVEPFHPARI